MIYTASCSFGKDSLAMILLLLDKGYPLDIVIFYDTGMEFNAIYNNRDKLVPILKEHGIKYVELKPDNPFLYDMLERPVKGRTNQDHFGYGWCGGTCRWGTTAKNRSIANYLDSLHEPYKEYIGIAFDEQERVKDKLYPPNRHENDRSRLFEILSRTRLALARRGGGSRPVQHTGQSFVLVL